MEKIPYPADYFDPYGDEPTQAQCTVCGSWKDIGDMADVEEVSDIIGVILQGVCLDCVL